MSDQPKSSAMPDEYDRTMGLLIDLPDVVKTRASIVRVVPTLGVGGVKTFVVQTVRQEKQGDTLFLEIVGLAEGTQRLIIPPSVTKMIARQRDAVTFMSRKKAAKQAQATRVERGIVPFQKRAKQG